MNINSKIFLFIITAVALALPQIVCAQVKQHDFTQGNKTLENKQITPETSRLSDKRTGLEEKSFKTREYKVPHKSDSLIEKSFYMEDKNPMFSPETSHKDSDKKFAEKKFTPDKENWRNSEKQQKLFDTERDMSKTYKGKIDIEKRAIFDTDYLRHVYEDMQERSMQDINKYQFRRSHPTDPGIKTTIAGSEHTAVDDGSSFLDNFSLRDKIQVDVPSATFKGNPTSRSAQRAQKVQKAPKVSEMSSEGLIKKSDTVRKSKGKVQSVEYIDSKESQKYDFLRVPKGMKAKGKAVIKVETDE